MQAVTAEQSGRGRPRDDRRRSAVVRATRELLIADGYDDLTLTAVAKRAGVSRPFVYDNWGTKFTLVQDAIFSTDAMLPELDMRRSFAHNMTELLLLMVRVQSDPAHLAGLPGVVSELYNRPDLVDEIEQRYIAPVRALYVDLVDHGKARGTVRADVDGSALLDTVRGAIMLHTLVNPALDEAALIDHLTSTILRGISVR